jgi:hypothetical protein
MASEDIEGNEAVSLVASDPYPSRPSKAEMRYSAFVTKNLLPPVVLGND